MASDTEKMVFAAVFAGEYLKNLYCRICHAYLNYDAVLKRNNELLKENENLKEILMFKPGDLIISRNPTWFWFKTTKGLVLKEECNHGGIIYYTVFWFKRYRFVNCYSKAEMSEFFKIIG